MGNIKKSATLGMPHGTAVGRLRKNILFHLLTKYGDNNCFKCGKKIDLVKDLSIEHKEPWEGISAELFWDLDNIAFSHSRCNLTHTRHGGTPKRIIGPEGTAWCGPHQKFEPVENFCRDSTRWNGFQSNCRESRYDR